MINLVYFIKLIENVGIILYALILSPRTSLA